MHGSADGHVLRNTLQSIGKKAMSDLRTHLHVPGEVEALRGLGQTARLRGSLMLKTRFWSWCCSYSFRLLLASYQLVLALDRITSFHAVTMSPGFLRAGRQLCQFLLTMHSV
jgi:hypothetical protein